MILSATTCDRRALSAILIALATLVTPNTPALGQTPPGEGKKVALLIGVNKYDKRGFRDLEYAERDVQELAQVLSQGGYEVHLLTGSAAGEKRATLANVHHAIDAALKGRTKKDLIVVALAGHGLQIEIPGGDGKMQSESFFCPADAESGNPQTMLPMGKLFEDINRRGGGQNVLLVDACREDPTRGRGGMDGGTVKTLPEGMAVLFGCRAGQKTFETKNAGGGHGVFFHVVLEGLRGKARGPEGEITWSRLTEYAAERVPEEAARLVGDAGIQQVPNEIRNIPGRAPVLLGPPKRKSWLGMAVAEAYKADAQQAGLDHTRGLKIVYVAAGSPAQRAGVKTSDMVLTVDGEEVASTNDPLWVELLHQTPGTKVRMEVWQGGKVGKVVLELAPRDELEIYKLELAQAEQGDAQAQALTASRLANGHGIGKNSSEALRWYQKAAEQGNHGAMFQLGQAYYTGSWLARDRVQAIQWLQKAADAGHPPAQEMLGRVYHDDEHDDAKAVAWLTKAAENDHRTAQSRLGWYLETGIGVAKDAVQAAKWYRQAAEAGSVVAQANLARLCMNGLGVPQDHAEALRWYRKAAQAKLPAAQNGLGAMYQNGYGVARDDGEAIRWFRLAAESKMSLAQYNLGRMYYFGHGVERDYAEAARWYRLAAEQGHADAQCDLARQCLTGQGVPRDETQGIRWLRKAAAGGHARSQTELGLAYTGGRGVPKDDEEAVKWFRKAAEQGHATGQNSLGLMYKRGRGVPKDEAQALQWFRKAAEHGSVAAMTNLGDAYRDAKDYPAALKAYYEAAVKKDDGAQRMMGVMAYHAEGCTQDYAVALKWFRQAADQGNADAQNWLGVLYARGHGVTRDTAEAARWYRKAAAQGLELAKKNLETLEQKR